MKSTIKMGIWYGRGTVTSTTGISTFQFPHYDRIGYLLLGNDIPIVLMVINATSANAKNPITGDAITVTANGNYNFSVSGLAWYTTPRAIGVL